jgi:hypothetical protein
MNICIKPNHDEIATEAKVKNAKTLEAVYLLNLYRSSKQSFQDDADFMILHRELIRRLNLHDQLVKTLKDAKQYIIDIQYRLVNRVHWHRGHSKRD